MSTPDRLATGVKTIDTLGDLRGKRVLVRSDFNVPLDGTTITDDGRIRAALPTLKALLDGGARVIVTAHLGRPKGAPEAKYSLAPVAARLGELLGQPVVLADDVVGESAKAVVAALADGEIALLENIRFDARETSKDDAVRGELADELAAFADAFVSDGFGVVHRKQASVYDAEAVRDERVGEGSQLVGQLAAHRVVLRRLAGVEADVLQQRDLAVGQRGHDGLG